MLTENPPHTAHGLAAPAARADHSRGPADAPVTLVEYADFDCPDCARAYPVIEEVLRKAGGRVRLLFRHFPIVANHPNSMNAAEAAEAAFAQGGEEMFWRMHDRLYRRGDKLGEHDLTHHAVVLGLEVYRFQSELDTRKHEGRVRQDIQSGQESGVKGTPTFFINGTRYAGPAQAEALLAAITAAEGTGTPV
jgi:protein-disulfide isomerase